VFYDNGSGPVPTGTSSNNNAQVINNTAAKLTSFRVPPSLGEALDATTINWTSGGDAPCSGNPARLTTAVTQRKVAALLITIDVFAGNRHWSGAPDVLVEMRFRTYLRLLNILRRRRLIKIRSAVQPIGRNTLSSFLRVRTRSNGATHKDGRQLRARFGHVVDQVVVQHLIECELEGMKKACWTIGCTADLILINVVDGECQ